MRSFINCTLSQIGIIKSNRLRWAEYVESMEVTTKAYKVIVGKTDGNTKKA
jgi:hypothetical protein